ERSELFEFGSPHARHLPGERRRLHVGAQLDLPLSSQSSPLASPLFVVAGLSRLAPFMKRKVCLRSMRKCFSHPGGRLFVFPRSALGEARKTRWRCSLPTVKASETNFF
ncbi:unnamed protein product, partial [Ixodes pacificus]